MRELWAAVEVFLSTEILRRGSYQHSHFTDDGVAMDSNQLLIPPLSSPSPPAFKLSQNWYFPMSQFFASDDQTIGVSASPSVLSMNIQD